MSWNESKAPAAATTAIAARKAERMASARGQLRVLRSPYGHDAFLKETDRIDNILAAALRDADRNETGETA